MCDYSSNFMVTTGLLQLIFMFQLLNTVLDFYQEILQNMWHNTSVAQSHNLLRRDAKANGHVDID